METAPHQAFKAKAGLRGMLVGSAALHVLLFIAIVLAHRTPHRSDPLPAIQTKLVRLGENRPDWLPRKEQPPPPRAEAVVPSAKAVDTPRADHHAEKQPSAFEQSLRHIDQIERDYKGKGDKAGRADGTVSELTKQMLGNAWVASVVERVRPNLTVPSVIAESERPRLKTTVTLFVGVGGQLLRHAISERSGNQLFDSAVLRAIEASAPLPPPPPDLREQVAKDGVDVEFLGSH